MSQGTRDQIAHVCWVIKKAREFQKKMSTSALFATPKPLTVWITKSVENSGSDGNARPPDLPLEKSVCFRKQQLELDMEEQTGSKSGKDCIKVVYCHPAYLAYMQSTS